MNTKIILLLSYSAVLSDCIMCEQFQLDDEIILSLVVRNIIIIIVQHITTPQYRHAVSYNKMLAQRTARVSLLLHKDSIYDILKSSLEAQLQLQGVLNSNTNKSIL